MLTAAPKSPGKKNTKLGNLQVTVLSAYDLPVREPPLCVSVQISNSKMEPVKTGPPAQRHKDRNSFKFSNGNHLNELDIQAPLPKLFQEVAIIEILYEKAPANKLVATYPLNQLRIGETTWLILHMDGTNEEDTARNDSVQVGPTLRLHMTLTGPYRMEIAGLVHLAQSWFGVVDHFERSTQNVLAKFPSFPSVDPKLLVIPAVPVLSVAVVSAPLVLGIFTLGLPLFLPLAAIALMIGLAFAVFALSAYCSTQSGRVQVGGVFSPIVSTMLSTKSGQRMIYQTGPRPSPVQLAKLMIPQSMWHRLMISFVIDFIGSSSYLIPIAGEFTDVVWAPFQTLLIMAMYEETSSSLKYLSFMEEIMPFTDIVPSATLGWLMQYAVPLVMNATKKQNITRSSSESTALTTNPPSAHRSQSPGEPSTSSVNSASSLPQVVEISNNFNATNSPI